MSLGVDCRSLEDIKKLVERKAYDLDGVLLDAGGVIIGLYLAIANDLPSVTPQEPQSFKWCTNCKEYDQEKHCCHRWSKVIRNTVEEMKQEYIERKVLDKIRAEIEQKCCITVGRENDPAITLYDVLQIMDKFEGESEE